MDIHTVSDEEVSTLKFDNTDTIESVTGWDILPRLLVIHFDGSQSQTWLSSGVATSHDRARNAFAPSNPR